MARRIPPPKGTFKFPGTIDQYIEAAEFWWEEKGDYKGFKEEFGVFDKDGEWFQVRKGRDSKTKKPKPVLVNQEGVEAFTMKRRMNEELPYYIEKQLKDLEKKGLLPEGASLKDFKKRISSGFNAMRKAKLEHFKKTGEYLDIGHWAPVGEEVSNVDWNLGNRPPNVPGNTRLESRILNRGGGNSIHKVPTRDALVNMGIPRNWTEAVSMYADPTGNPSPLFDNLEDLENFAAKSRDLVDTPDLTARQQLDDIVGELDSAKVKPSQTLKVNPISGLLEEGAKLIKPVTKAIDAVPPPLRRLAIAAPLPVVGTLLNQGQVRASEQRVAENPNLLNKIQLNLDRTALKGSQLSSAGLVPLLTPEPVSSAVGAGMIAKGEATDFVAGGASTLIDVGRAIHKGLTNPPKISTKHRKLFRHGGNKEEKLHVMKQRQLMVEMLRQQRKNQRFETGGKNG